MAETGVPLKRFVAETLQAIVAGVQEAAPAIEQNGGIVNPGTNWDKGWQTPFYRTAGVGIQFVEFDVAVTSSEGTEAKAGGGAALGPLVIGAGGKSVDQQSSVNRIRFSVPVLLPPGKRDS